MSTKTKLILMRILRGLTFFAALILGVLIVQYLWNLVVPDITGYTEINFWQTLALMIIGRILTGGFGGWVKHHKHYKHHRKFDTMSKEEKKEYLKNYFSKENEK